jgi:L-alanine-DL-glutamate epimerase-like enolase superfamily enzyme
MPATAIIGYPPGLMDAERVAHQVSELLGAGWRRFKAPPGVSSAATIERLRAARRAAPDAWIGHDAAWTFREVDQAEAFLDEVEDVELGWFEDIFPPGDATKVAQLRLRTTTPIAMGDEQGGSYYPESLLMTDAVDVVRIDLTCMGGISGGRRIVDECITAGVGFAPHMFAHVHSRVFSAWGFAHLPVEWGVPWTGVDPYADSLEQPVLDDGGRMLPLTQDPGFGQLVNRDWIATQEHCDPDGIFGL